MSLCLSQHEPRDLIHFHCPDPPRLMVVSTVRILLVLTIAKERHWATTNIFIWCVALDSFILYLYYDSQNHFSVSAVFFHEFYLLSNRIMPLTFLLHLYPQTVIHEKIPCQNQTLLKYFCLNGGKCLQIKSIYGDENFTKIGPYFCHCTSKWIGR